MTICGQCVRGFQRPNATHVAGFHSWLRLQRHVRKGEKGLVILAPMVGRMKSSDEDLAEDSQTRLYGFRAAHVFDISQTEGAPLAEFATVKGDPGDLLEKLKGFVVEHGIALEYSDRIRPALGTSSGGRITIVPGLNPAEHFSTLVHEAAHELLHRGDRRQSTNHVIRETEAEAVAYVVNSAIGLELATASSDYIQLHAGDRATLAESLGFVQQTAGAILKAIWTGPS
jgi:antirestriction protein ArdC